MQFENYNSKSINMKKNLKVAIITVLMVSAPILVLAQTPPHPNGGSNPGVGNGPVGGGAPIGSGTLILFSLALAYSITRFNEAKRKEQEKVS